jgi:hypothetical protein
MSRNQDLFALLDEVEQMAELVLGFKGRSLRIRRPITWPNLDLIPQPTGGVNIISRTPPFGSHRERGCIFYWLSAGDLGLREPNSLVGRLSMPRLLPEPDARSAAVLIDELDAGFLEGAADRGIVRGGGRCGSPVSFSSSIF